MLKIYWSEKDKELVVECVAAKPEKKPDDIDDIIRDICGGPDAEDQKS